MLVVLTVFPSPTNPPLTRQAIIAEPWTQARRPKRGQRLTPLAVRTSQAAPISGPRRQNKKNGCLEMVGRGGRGKRAVRARCVWPLTGPQLTSLGHPLPMATPSGASSWQCLRGAHRPCGTSAARTCTGGLGSR